MELPLAMARHAMRPTTDTLRRYTGHGIGVCGTTFNTRTRKKLMMEELIWPEQVSRMG